MLRVALISDTHGLLRPEALDHLRGADYIVHAGDIGDPAILARLAALAPLTAVRGNNDKGPWAEALRDRAVLKAGDARVYVLHDLAELDLDPAAAGFRAVVSGHSHRPRAEEREGVLFVTPGSADPRRFRLPVCVGELRIAGASVSARLVELSVSS
jgi:uncharacterized protein